jgi:lysophospholipase L1-like esterase
MSQSQSLEDDPETYQDSYPAQITLHIVGQFVQEIAKNGAIPLVLVFPEQHTIADYEAGIEPVYQTGVTALRDQGVQVIDLAGAFVEAKQTQNLPYEDFYASEGGHFNELGNYVVAQAVLWHLCGQGILNDC